MANPLIFVGFVACFGLGFWCGRKAFRLRLWSGVRTSQYYDKPYAYKLRRLPIRSARTRKTFRNLRRKTSLVKLVDRTNEFYSFLEDAEHRF